MKPWRLICTSLACAHYAGSNAGTCATAANLRWKREFLCHQHGSLRKQRGAVGGVYPCERKGTPTERAPGWLRTAAIADALIPGDR